LSPTIEQGLLDPPEEIAAESGRGAAFTMLGSDSGKEIRCR
jgi:hypothetical protein